MELESDENNPYRKTPETLRHEKHSFHAEFSKKMIDVVRKHQHGQGADSQSDAELGNPPKYRFDLDKAEYRGQAAAQSGDQVKEKQPQ